MILYIGGVIHFSLLSRWETALWSCASLSNRVIMQRSQPKILRSIANALCYVTSHTLHTDFNIRYVRSSMKKSWTPQQTGRPSQSTIRAATTTYKHQETKKVLAFTPTRHLRWRRWMNTLTRHSNKWYSSVLCIMTVLAYRMYSF